MYRLFYKPLLSIVRALVWVLARIRNNGNPRDVRSRVIRDITRLTPVDDKDLHKLFGKRVIIA